MMADKLFTKRLRELTDDAIRESLAEISVEFEKRFGPAALTASPPVEREAIARIIDPDCAKVTWAGTDDEQHIVRMRVCRERLKQWGDDGECDHDGRCEECSFDMAKVLETDASKARRAEALAKADAILALTPVEGVERKDVPAGVMDALAKVMPIRVQDGPDYAEVFFSDGVAHSTQAMTMNPQDWRDLDAAVMAALSTPVAQGDEVRDALRLAIAHIKSMAAWIGKHPNGYHFEALGEDMPSIEGALATLTKGARDAG